MTDTLHDLIRQAGLGEKMARSAMRDWQKTLESRMAQCPDPECPICSAAACPYGCDMHFHHDGCPECAQRENPQ